MHKIESAKTIRNSQYLITAHPKQPHLSFPTFTMSVVVGVVSEDMSHERRRKQEQEQQPQQASKESILPVPVEEKTILHGDIVQISMDVPKKGRNVSGRSWKVRPQKRASTLIKTKVNNQVKSFTQRLDEKKERKESLVLQSELREERRQTKVLKKERRLENEKRRAENEYKQASKSAKQLNLGKLSSTLKAMSKKQLRHVKKTRMNTKTGVVEYVPAYTK